MPKQCNDQGLSFYIHKNSLKFLIFFNSYLLSSGYKPAPMDLSCIKLTPSQESMVDKLAENAHNVWARDRIRQGWTYGIQQVSPDILESL